MAKNILGNFAEQLANREVCDLIFRDYETGAISLDCDYANTSTVELTGETVYAYGGKGHAKKIGFAGERGGTMTIETQVQTPKLWEIISGGTSSTSDSIVKKVECIVGKDKTITLTETDSISAGSVMVYLASDTDRRNQLASTVVDKVITLTDTQPEGTKVVVFYGVVKEDIYSINIKSTSFPKAFVIQGETVMKAENDKIYSYIIKAHKAMPQPNMSLSFSNSGDPGTITMTLDLLEDRDHNMLTMDLIPDGE